LFLRITSVANWVNFISTEAKVSTRTSAEKVIAIRVKGICHERVVAVATIEIIVARKVSIERIIARVAVDSI
jgi:hypothetical protein